MNFRLEKIDGKTVAVLDDKGKARNWFLAQLLLPPKCFIIELLHDITQIEKELRKAYGCEDLYVYITPFLEQITIEPNLPEEKTEVQQIEIQLDAAKLLLFEWGSMLHRLHIEQKEQ